jgi:CMP/dCMP kinase
VLARTNERDSRDHDRYARLYGYDVDQYDFARLVVDTEKLDQEGVAGAIVDFARRECGFP